MLNHPPKNTSLTPPFRCPTAAGQSGLSPAPPRWLSTDLRDGNQALAEPMDSARKLQFWDLLLSCGFKKSKSPSRPPRRRTSILCRQLIEKNRIPDDVTIQVLTQARDDLIHRTFDSLRGAKPGHRSPV